MIGLLGVMYLICGIIDKSWCISCCLKLLIIDRVIINMVIFKSMLIVEVLVIKFIKLFCFFFWLLWVWNCFEIKVLSNMLRFFNCEFIII